MAEHGRGHPAPERRAGRASDVHRRRRASQEQGILLPRAAGPRATRQRHRGRGRQRGRSTSARPVPQGVKRLWNDRAPEGALQLPHGGGQAEPLMAARRHQHLERQLWVRCLHGDRRIHGTQERRHEA